MNKLDSSFRISDKKKIKLYKALLKPRLIEEKMLLLLRQGKISKWFSGIGQEAISVGCTEALDKDETIFTMHRNLGVFTSRNVPLNRLFSQWQGKKSGFTKGRDRSFHFGSKAHNIVGMISHLGPQLSLAGGVALAKKIKKEKKVALAFTGEGGTSQGEFHEALNVASVWKLPVIFVIENNGYGLSTPTSEQYNCEFLSDRAAGYGMETRRIDGNNIEEVYLTIKEVSEKMKENPEPFLIECMTFRMRGHEEASGVKYVPLELMDEWGKRDPIKTYESFLKESGLLTDQNIEQFETEIKEEISQHLEMAFAEEVIESSVAIEVKDVYADYAYQATEAGKEGTEIRFVDAISAGLNEAMDKNDSLVIMGQDVAEYGGVFKITDGMVEKYGNERVRNTPLCESAIVGAALGLSMEGMKSVVEMQFADFVTCGFNQIINNLAKLHYRWAEKADVVIRMPTGGAVGAGPFHSQSTEAWFTHTPGLKVVYPSNPYDAKGLLIASIEDPNPVLYFEHKALYRSITGFVPDGYYNLEIGKAAITRAGDKASIITYGLGVHWAKALIEEKQLDVEIIDLRSLLPIDYETVFASVKKTGKVLILHEDCLTGGIGGDLSAQISEHCFEYLDAPVIRVASLDTPVPFAKNLEEKFLAKYRLEERLDFLLSY